MRGAIVSVFLGEFWARSDFEVGCKWIFPPPIPGDPDKPATAPDRTQADPNSPTDNTDKKDRTHPIERTDPPFPYPIGFRLWAESNRGHVDQ